MFFKTQIEDLQPDTDYQATFEIELATNVPEGLAGIGGSPGESVYVKAGATPVEPQVAEAEDGWLRVNIDKGNQAEGGEDMVVIGDIAHPDLEDQDRYEIKVLTNQGSPLTASTDSDGRLWLIVGTDSGFEGLTAICYARIAVDVHVVGEAE